MVWQAVGFVICYSWTGVRVDSHHPADGYLYRPVSSFVDFPFLLRVESEAEAVAKGVEEDRDSFYHVLHPCSDPDGILESCDRLLALLFI